MTITIFMYKDMLARTRLIRETKFQWYQRFSVTYTVQCKISVTYTASLVLYDLFSARFSVTCTVQ